MKKFLPALFSLLLLWNHSSNAQCAPTTNNAGTVDVGCNAFAADAGIASTAYRTFSAVNGVNYSVSTCHPNGTASWTQGSTLTIRDNSDALLSTSDLDNVGACSTSSLFGSLNWTSTFNGTVKAFVYNWPCGDTWPGTSAVLRVRQNTTVTNTTSTATICANGTKSLTATLGGTHNNPTIVFSKVGGTAGGSVSGTTYTHSGATGTVVIRAQVGVCFSDITFNVDAAPTLGTVSTSGPIDFCNSGGDFGTAVTVSGQVGSVVWDWGSNNGVWNNNWVFGTSSGTCCFPKKTSNSDGNADRIRYRVSNGVCPSVTSSTILIRNRFNEAPSSLASSSSTYCAASAPATITLTATFPNNINMNGTVAFYSGSCGGTLVGTVSPFPTSASASITISAPASTTQYFARYEPGTGTGCLNTTCATTTVTVLTSSVAPTGIAGTTTICSGSSTTLTVSGGSLGTGADWQWFTGSCGGTPVGTGPSITVSPSSNTTYFVRASGTCNTTGCASQLVTVQQLSVAPSSASGSATICSGGSSTLAVVGGSLGTGATWQWYSGSCGGVSVGTGASISVSPSSTTDYFVRAEGTCNTTTCAPATVTVVADPSITITGTATVCSGGSATLNSSPSGGTGTCTTTWWSSPDNSVWTNTGATGNSYTPTNITSTTFYQARRSCTGNGCDLATSNSIQITVVSDPDVTITPSQEVCTNAAVTLNASTTGGTGTCTIQWHVSSDSLNWTVAGTGSSLSTGVLTATRFYRARYSCTGSGCDADTSNVSKVSVVPNPTVSITPSQTVCNGALVTLVATPSSGTGNYQWQFFNGSVWVNTGLNSPSFTTPSLTLTTSYRVVFSPTGTGCIADTSNVSVVTVVSDPSISIGVSQTICEGGSVALTSNVSGGTGTPSYQWQFWNGSTWVNVIGATSSSFTTPPLTATIDYRCLYSTSGNGCDQAVSNTVTITVVPDPVITIFASGTFCGSANVTLTSSVSGGTGTTSYQWQQFIGFSWVNISGANSPTYNTGTITTTTSYRCLYIRDGVGCNVAESNDVTITIVPSITNNILTPTYQRFCQSGDPVLIDGATPADGTGTYTYLWEESLNNGATWSPAPGVNNAEDYDPATTSVTRWFRRVVTSGVCSSTSPVSIVNILPLPTISSVTKTDVKCFGGNDGTISVSGSSANGGVLYSLNGSPYQPSPFTGLTIGSYNLTIRDDSLCSNTFNANPIVINQPPLLVANVVDSVDASCANVFDGRIVAAASGGVGSYQYSLNGGPNQASPTFNGLAAGVYAVIVTDGNGCTATDTVTLENQFVLTANLDSVKNVSCFGGNDGEIYVTLIGGVPPYAYSINGVTFQPAPVFTGLTTNNYVVTLRDSRGCTEFLNANVTQPGLLSVLIDSVKNALCSGGATGSIFITVAGGTPSFNFLWSNGSTNKDLLNVVANTYNLTITDSKGCTAVGGATISEPLPLSATIASFGNVKCFGQSNGFIDISVAGGVPPYTFNWSNTATTEDLINIPSGVYDVTVTDKNGCSVTLSQSISEPTLLTSSTIVFGISCFGGNTGSVDLTVNGGTLPYTFFWSNGATTEDIGSLTAGIYTVLVTDANGCTTTNVANVNQPADISISPTVTNALCNGATGTITLTVTGGTGGYTFNWSNGGSSNSITDVAGTYSVTVTDGNGCSKTASYTITQPTAIVVNASIVDVNCFGGNTGSISLNVNGGTFPYSFAWSNAATSQNISGLTGGNYTVTITDANGCTFSNTYNVNAPSSGLATTMSGTNLNCNGDGNGTASVSVTGGTAPYSYNWSTFANTSSISNLNGGTYFVTVTDVNGCTARDSIIITEPAAIQINSTVTNALCNGATGTITLTVTGGTGGYTFNWSNGGSSNSITDVAGTYSVTVTDGNGCIKSASYTITQPTAIVVNASIVDVNCFGGNTGSISLNVNGGTFPYSFAWSNAATSQNISGLTGGSYTVTITDANGCTFSNTYNVNAPSSGLATGMSGTNLNCNGDGNGTASVTVTGGTAPYSYNWSTFANTASISNLNGGTYFVTVTDVNGCSARDSIIITEPAAIQINSTVTNALCNGATGTVTLSVTGGTGTYSYNWSNGGSSNSITDIAGTYSVTVTDGNGCSKTASYTITQPTAIVVNESIVDVNCFGGNTGSISLNVNGGTFPYSFAWSNGATSQNISGLTGGNYTVTITDANGCTFSNTYTVNAPSSGLATTMSGTNPLCHNNANGTASVSVTGGTAPYSYLWSNFDNTTTISGLVGAKYTVIVTDANGCSARDTIVLVNPAPITVSPTIVNVLCNGLNGSITLSVSGGTGAYAYAWSNGGNTNSISDVAGTYSVTVTDGNNCSTVNNFTISQPDTLSITANVMNSNCDGSNPGSIALNVSGGTAPYSYNWSNGGTTSTISGLLAGNYDVTVTDFNGCTKTASYSISQTNGFAISGVVTPILCGGSSSGSIVTSVTNATFPVSYSWSSGDTTPNLFGLAPGSYTVTATDAAGCIAVASFTITAPDALAVTLDSLNDANCSLSQTGAIYVSVAGGTSPYIYSWSNGATTQDITGLTGGTYVLIVTDNKGCTQIASFSVNDPTAPFATALVLSPSCFGSANGSVDVTTTGGNPGYSFLWSNGATTEDLLGVAAGLFNLTITDQSGCVYQLGVNVTQPNPISLNFSAIDGNCTGATGSANVVAFGGTPTYTYLWSNAETTATITGLVAGTYTVTVTDFNACTATGFVNISQAGSLDIQATISNAGCFGTGTGSIFTNTFGGTLPYSYAWSNGAATPNLINVGTGVYTVSVTDGQGCIRVKSFTVGGNTQIVVNGTVSDADCSNNTLGSITTTTTGGTSPYTYLWLYNGATTPNVSNLIAGNYVVIVQDNQGCTTAKTFVVNEASGFSVSGTQNNITCNGANDGSITITVNGGVGPYAFLWNDNVTNQNRSSLSAGFYTVTVTDIGNNNCQFLSSFIINEPSPIALTNINTNANCFGAPTGIIDLVVNGGSAPYSFIWSNGFTTEDLVGVAGGVYSVTVTDAFGCSKSGTFVLGQPAAINVAASVNNPNCFNGTNGSIFLNVTGGLSPYTFAWNTGDSTQSLNSLSPNTYSVTITDANNCSTVQSYNITAPAPVVVTATGTDADCVNNILGSIDASVSGGTAPYTYLWNNFATTQDLSNLFAGTYVLIVTDALGCTGTVSYTVNDISNNIAVSETITNASCPGSADGDIDVTVSGGTLPYTFTWSNGATTEDISGLTAGNYSLTVIDGAGCGFFKGFTVGSPDSIVIAAVITDATCGGGPDGAIDLTVSGGAGTPYAFQWSNGANTEDLNLLAAGTYTVTVTDGGGCQQSQSFNVSAGGTLVVTAAVNNVSCTNGSNGNIFLTVSGGTPPYTYLWSNGSTTAALLNVPQGNYNVSVTDAGGCIKIETISVTQPVPLQIVNPVITNILCFGLNTGEIDITVVGGTGNRTYLWSSSETTEDITGKTAGLYSVVVTDANGCSATGAFTIAQPADLTIASTVNNVLCNGGTGTVTLTVTGGTGTYSYNWSNGGSSNSITDVAGTYSVTVTDGNGCSKTASYTITQPTAIVVNASIVDVNCFGGNTGSISLNVNGGTFPYSFAWSNAATSQNISGLTGGSYTVTITDANGCTFSNTYTVNAPSSGLATGMSGTNLNCNGDGNGTASVTVTGGTAPYSYNWSTFANTSSISNLNGGTYFVTVTDVNGCTARDSIIITEPAAIQINATVTNALCNGATGTVSLTVTGGTGGYTFNWSNGGSSNSITDVAGIYSVTVTDGNGCSKTASYTITQPTAIVVNESIVDVNCFGGNTGSISLNVNGGTFPYSFAWSNGATSQNISGLTGGSYTVTITDANGCTFSNTYTVNAPSSGLATGMSGTNLNCNGDGNGTASVTVTGGTAPYSYNWSTFANTASISNLNGGTYFVTVTDVNGCSARDSIIITEPAAIQINSTVTNALCNGATGTVTLSVTGGTGTYSYNWSNGGSSNSITDIAGTYSVTVTDGNGCSKTASYTITQPAAGLAITGVATDANCNGTATGTITINVIGGTIPYSYVWSNGSNLPNQSGLVANTYTVTITDANGCTLTETYTINEPAVLTASVVGTDVSCAGAADGEVDLTVGGGTAPYTYAWSNFANTEDLSGISGGFYTVIVTDAKGCTARDTVTIFEPTPIVLIVQPTNVACNGGSTGSVNLTVTGGAPNYTFIWTGGATTEDIFNVPAGVYSVTVTDSRSCTARTSATVTEPAAPLAIFGSSTNVSCNGSANGSVSINVIGGTVPYNYTWSNGSNLPNQSGLNAGVYTITVTDGNGCTATETFTITEPSVLTTSVSGTNVSCAGAADGTVDLDVQGGTTPYSYAWNSFANTQDLIGIGGGKYIVIVTDAKGCTARDSITITEPQPLVIKLNAITNVSCNNGANGAIDISISGGTLNYSILWSNGLNTEDVSGLVAGTYSVTVTDANNCTATQTFIITEPAAIQVSAVVKNVSCAGAADGAITQAIVGGVQPYTFNWDIPANTQDVANLSGGVYNFTVTDANNCTAVASYTVLEPQPLASTVAKTDVDCPGAANGAATVNVTGGTLPYTYFWSNFTINQSINAVSGGKYYVIIRDKNGCELRDSVEILEPQPIVITASVTNLSCFGANDGQVQLNVVGGTAPYTYAWSNGGTNDSIANVAAGTYTVTVTDFNNCTKAFTVTVTQPVLLSLTGIAVDALCNGASNGKVDITVVGGTIPYTFLWSNGATTEDLNNVQAGIYDVTVTDNANCTATGSFTVGEPTPIVSSVVVTDVTCFGLKNGAADLSVSGGTPPYTFLWSTFQGSEDISSLNGGLYIVIITDNLGCEKRDSANVFEPQPLVLTTAVQQISCFNANDGSINLTVTGGTQPYTFAWSNGSGSQNLSQLPGGTYSVTVTDAQNCSAVTTVQIVNPSMLNTNALVKTPRCSGESNGSIDLIVSGGTPPYTFNWNSGQTTEDLQNIPSATYVVTVTDSKGCTATDTVDVSQPLPLYTTGFITDVSCFGYSDGFVDITAYGGTLPYFFEWSTGPVTEDLGSLSGGSYIVTVTDGNGCTVNAVYNVFEPQKLQVNVQKTDALCFGTNTGTVSAVVTGGMYPYYYLWSNFDVDSFQNGVGAGKYIVIVTDSNFCRAVDSAIVNQPARIVVDATVLDAKCNGVNDGSITLSVSGGVAPYTYAWSHGPTTGVLNNVAAGTYTVTITDATGCTVVETYTVGEREPLYTNMSVSNPICGGGNTGFASVVVTGGQIPYTYSWSTTPAQTGATATTLKAGVYVVSITDKAGCVKTDTATLSEPNAIIVTTNSTAAKCSNSPTGKVVATATGGVPPYVYILNNITQSTNEFAGLQPGTYTILVRDVNGCEGVSTFTIDAPNDISVQLFTDKQVILSGMEAQLSAVTNSTKSVISHVWTPVGTFNFSNCADSTNCSDPRVAPQTTTIYSVVVMDEDSCSASDTIRIEVRIAESAFMPTAFSPNGDGLNDKFVFDILGAIEAEVRIYDRWGNLIYENMNQANGVDNPDAWDGTFKGELVQYDTYVYQMKVKFFDGAEKVMTGTIAVMR